MEMAWKLTTPPTWRCQRRPLPDYLHRHSFLPCAATRHLCGNLLLHNSTNLSALAPLSSNLQDSAVLDAAWEILEEFNRNDIQGLEQPSLQSGDGQFALGASVVAAVDALRAQEGCLPLLGICAHNTKEALTALKQWTAALGCECSTPHVLDSKHDLKTMPGPVYVKYNPQAKSSYLQAYSGRFRGVIVQIGQKQVGHLPLSLFEPES